jgi:dienelactone hydrolase
MGACFVKDRKEAALTMRHMRKLLVFAALALVMLASPVRADDLLVDGVPLPSDATVAEASSGSAAQQQWSGAWVGAWDGTLKHILFVESVSEDGRTKVVYANGENPFANIQPNWRRFEASVSGSTLTVTGVRFSATYDMAADGSLKALFKLGNIVSRATMTRADLASLTKPDAVVAWTRGKSEYLQTELVEDGKPVRLEAVIFKPAGAGPFPLAVINHGSTGTGRNSALFAQTWLHVGLADFLNERGWIVAFPQRRGRGKSDGLYDEGFSVDRKLGYMCDTEISLRGADRALGDIDAAIAALRRRPDVAPGPILIGGQSRGGVLAVAYAGLHPLEVSGVINFVGGWLGEGCPAGAAANQNLFERGAHYAQPTIWLYGHGDRFYSVEYSRGNFAAFEKAGGKGKFLDFDVPSGRGHSVLYFPDLWSAPLNDYLHSLAAGEKG